MTAAVVPSHEPRNLLICRARNPLCPRCGNPIHRVQVDTGSVFATCDALRTAAELRADPRLQSRCGAHLHILGTGHGLCLVVGLSDDEFTYLAGRPRDPTELYEYLGALATRAWIRDRARNGAD